MTILCLAVLDYFSKLQLTWYDFFI